MAGQVIDVFEVIRGAVHDGPGLRTTIFVKGCPLRCIWCQNPEGISPSREVWLEERKCIKCAMCLDACSANVITQSNNQRVNLIDRSACIACGNCVDTCPAYALSYTSKVWTQEALLHEALKDKLFYAQSGGGITVSGGEPLLYADFLELFFSRLRKVGVHTALDTCGCVPTDALLKVLTHSDMLLYDIKLIDDDAHKNLTGKGNKKILENLKIAAEYIRNTRRDNGRNIALWIRTPLIPEATAGKRNIAEIASFISDYVIDIVARWELCTFNPTCESKYRRLGLPWNYEGQPLITQSTVTELRDTAYNKGIPKETLTVTGMTSASK